MLLLASGVVLMFLHSTILHTTNFTTCWGTDITSTAHQSQTVILTVVKSIVH